MPPAFILTSSPTCIWAEANGIIRKNKNPAIPDEKFFEMLAAPRMPSLEAQPLPLRALLGICYATENERVIAAMNARSRCLRDGLRDIARSASRMTQYGKT